MSKEVFVAILAGSVFGLVIAFGVWRANIFLNTKRTPTDDGSSKIVNVNGKEQSKIAISAPENLEVMTDSPTEITGLTNAANIVVVSGEDSDSIQTVTDSGSFQVPVDLSGGSNQVKVSSFGKDFTQSDADLLLVFSTEFQKVAGASDSASVATNDAVRARLSEAINTGTSYLGTITDLPDDTIQIKSIKGEIEQIAIDPNTTTFIKQTNNSSKLIKKTDLAIGDFIVAMGTRNGNGVLTSSRVLVTDAYLPTNRKVIAGSVSSLTKNSFSLKAGGTTYTVSVDGNTSVYQYVGNNENQIKFASLKEGNGVIVSGGVKDSNVSARTIWSVNTK